MTVFKTPLQELPGSQLARHVDPFHLVITDKWRPGAWLFSARNTLPPTWCGPSYKAPYSFQPSCCALNPRGAAQQSVLPINLSFLHVVWSLLGSSLYLVPKPGVYRRLTGCSGPGLAPWLSSPALSRTQTAELTPCVYLRTVVLRPYCLASSPIHH
jgi:hypothetical protein